MPHMKSMVRTTIFIPLANYSANITAESDVIPLKISLREYDSKVRHQSYRNTSDDNLHPPRK